MTAHYVISPAAQSDLDEIWDYTAGHWNAIQADRYVVDLDGAIEAAASGERSGRACDDIRPGYFRLLSGSHVVFCRMDGARLQVVRILHQRMDFGRRL
ncbi:MAG: type II toxin-antitoxin system RelE/ParE family toxin [Rhizomicrobium sp.]